MGAILDPIGDHSGTSSALLRASWGLLGASCGLPGVSWGPLGAEGSKSLSGSPVEALSWSCPRSLLGDLGNLLGRLGSWAVLGPSRGLPGLSWSGIGVSVGRIQPYEGRKVVQCSNIRFAKGIWQFWGLEALL